VLDRKKVKSRLIFHEGMRPLDQLDLLWCGLPTPTGQASLANLAECDLKSEKQPANPPLKFCTIKPLQRESYFTNPEKYSKKRQWDYNPKLAFYC